MNEENVRRMADCVISGGGERYSVQNCGDAIEFMDHLLHREGVIGLSIIRDCRWCLHSLDYENVHPHLECNVTAPMDDSAWVKIQLRRLDSA